MPSEEDKFQAAVAGRDGLPAEIDLGRHRDCEGRNLGQWLRRGFLTLLVLFLVAALANVFGQAAAIDTASGTGGTLAVKAPSRVRGGLTYQGEFVIHATQALGARRPWSSTVVGSTRPPSTRSSPNRPVRPPMPKAI